MRDLEVDASFIGRTFSANSDSSETETTIPVLLVFFEPNGTFTN